MKANQKKEEENGFKKQICLKHKLENTKRNILRYATFLNPKLMKPLTVQLVQEDDSVFNQSQDFILILNKTIIVHPINIFNTQ